MDRADGDYWVVEAVTLGYENVLFPFVAVLAGSLLAFLSAMGEQGCNSIPIVEKSQPVPHHVWSFETSLNL